MDDITNQKFGKLTAIEKSPNKSKDGRTQWVCKCECGNTTEIIYKNLKSGNSKSCGKCVVNVKDITGEKYGMLTVISRSDYKGKNNSVWWNCQCDCGNTKVIRGDNLRAGNVTNCGCVKQTEFDITGKRFGKWMVLNRVPGDYMGKSLWLCECDCGTIKVVQGPNLRSGTSKSCGCYNKLKLIERNTKHGYAKRDDLSPTYVTWQNMKARCLKPSNKDYPNYGGRSIKICDKWLESFSNFIEDMGECPKGYSIDRINVDGNYEPSNCRWVSSSGQSRNTRITRLTEEVVRKLRSGEMTTKEAQELTGANSGTVWNALKRITWLD